MYNNVIRKLNNNTSTCPGDQMTDFTLMWPCFTAKWRHELASLSILFKMAEQDAPTWLAENKWKEQDSGYFII